LDLKTVFAIVGGLATLKYLLLEGKEVIVAGGKVICSIKKAIHRIRNSK